MTYFQVLRIAIQIILIILLALMALIMHRIGTIRKWEIEKERELRNQPEFWDENAV